jgi:hypothetical protein
MARCAITMTSRENEAKAGGLVVEARIVIGLPNVMSNNYVNEMKYIRTLSPTRFFA